MFHGYSHYCGDWSEKLNYVAAVVTVAALEPRIQAEVLMATGFDDEICPVFRMKLLRL